MQFFGIGSANHKSQVTVFIPQVNFLGYNLEKPPPGPRNYLVLIGRSARMEGFLVFDYASRFEEARRKLAAWVAEGEIAWRIDVQEGIENAPRTFLRLFRGDNLGKQLLLL